VSSQVVIPCLLVLLVAGPLSWIVLTFASAISSRNWPRTVGIVVHSPEGMPPTWLHPGHQPAVVYRYTVDGRHYTSTRWRFGDELRADYASRHEIEIARNHPVGKSVGVRYNPHDPSESVIEPGPSIVLTLVLCVAILWLVGGIAA